MQEVLVETIPFSFQFNHGEVCNLTGLVPLAGKLLFKSSLGYFLHLSGAVCIQNYVEPYSWHNFGYGFMNVKLL